MPPLFPAVMVIMEALILLRREVPTLPAGAPTILPVVAPTLLPLAARQPGILQQHGLLLLLDR